MRGLRGRVAGHSIVRRITEDALYRGSTLLLLNTALLSGFGFAFWAVAARLYPTDAVGAFAGITAGVGLLGAVGALGLPNTLMRHLALAPSARQLATVAVVASTTAGGALCLIVVLFLGGHLPGELDLAQADHRILVAVLAMLAAVGAVIDGGLIALRSTRQILTKNLAGSIAKLGVLGALAASGVLGMVGLVTAYGIGAGLAAFLGGVALFRRVRSGGGIAPPRRDLRRYLSFSGSSYLGTVVGILPATIVPLMVLTLLGPEETAYFTIAFMLASFLNFVPSTTAQVLMAEVSRGDRALRVVVSKAVRHVYSLLLPAVLILVLGAPFVLRIFGPGYADGATTCLQLLGLGALATGCTYLIDAILAARDRMGAYIAMNVANALLVLGLVGLALPHGLAAAGAAWVVAQAASVALGLVALRVTGVWRSPGSRASLALAGAAAEAESYGPGRG
ncbi:oligosaccharide flippase family protein [Miltoncostaea oceani]|uniref:oligosaccharide flippase family protein n=1 Tax=Miltoncostaea oceani TaxID=2843216 RepID=UPI001C3CD3EE|nr:oligosaccharide flippase family protein [Miltoncostaea oceani]